MNIYSHVVKDFLISLQISLLLNCKIILRFRFFAFNDLFSKFIFNVLFFGSGNCFSTIVNLQSGYSYSIPMSYGVTLYDCFRNFIYLK